MKARTVLALLLILGIGVPLIFFGWGSAEQRVSQYEVLVQGVQLPTFLTEEDVVLWVQNGWLRAEEHSTSEAPDNGNERHLVYYYYGDGSYYCDCVDGAGVISCFCSDSPLPPNQ
jgi:hypothetical protein